MIKFDRTTPTILRLLTVSLGLGIIVAIEVGVASGALRVSWNSVSMWRILLPLGGLVLAISGTILHAFTATLEHSTRRIMAILAGASLALLTGLESVHAISTLSRYLHFSTALVAQIGFTFAVAQFLVLSIKIDGRWRTAPPFIATGIVAICGIIGLAGQNWLALDQMAIILSSVRDGVLLMVPTLVLLACAFIPQLRLDKKSRLESLKLRLNSVEVRGVWWRDPLRSVFVGLLTSLLIFGIANILGFLSPDSVWAAASCFCLGWLGILSFGIHEIHEFSKKQMQGAVTARLATHSAKRFLNRHATGEKTWAATVGLRTTNFNIDHDPGSFLHSQLPASIMQIRNEEIQRCISEVLGTMHMHTHVVGPRIFGAIDTELSVRPCTDTLKMFACLYLDAGPLVERRIKGLVSLLPIVDPGLARVLGPKDISGLIRRNLWFFHFDFGWIDQHLIHTPRATKYDVRIDGLSSHSRYALIDHFERMGGTGNIIWLGPEARARLLQEAPALRNIIEPCPIRSFGINLNTENTSSNVVGQKADEMLMFTIRFEQLIPRLQRYFDLDSMRRSLLDFEPSVDSRRLLNLISLQASKADSPEATKEVLEAITSVPWHGFKEKDSALQLILTVYNNLTASLSGKNSLAESEDPKDRAVHAKLLDAVRTVGYPSQILHDAQVHKIALRDVGSLVAVAGNSKHSRFHEAWLLMATSDYGRHTADQRLQLINFLTSIHTLPNLKNERLVQIKAIDAICSLGHTSGPEELASLTQCLDNLGLWFADKGADAEVLSLYVDAYLFLSQHHDTAVAMGQRTSEAFKKVLSGLEDVMGSDHPKLVALLSRWQELIELKKSLSAKIA